MALQASFKHFGTQAGRSAHCPRVAAYALLGVLALVEVMAGAWFFRTHYGNAVSAYVVIALLVLAAAAASCKRYLLDQAVPRADRIRAFLRHAGASAGIAIALEVGTLFGYRTASPLDLAAWNGKRLLIWFGVAYGAILVRALWGAPASGERGVSWHTRAGHALGRAVGRVPGAVRRVLPYVVVIGVVDAAIALAAAVLLHRSWYAVFISAVCVSTSITLIIQARRHGTLFIERLFLAIAIPAGCLLILVFPASNLLSWDDEIHYQRSVALSYIDDVEMSASDRMIAEHFLQEDGFSADASFERMPVAVSPTGRFTANIALTWPEGDIERFCSELDAHDTAASIQVSEGIDPGIASINAIGYLPAAIGLWIGRLLHVPFVVRFMLGRLANLLVYCLVTYQALRIIPVKKLVLCAIALLPTNVFMAANYSYDPWLIAFTHLAVAVFVREYLRDRTVRWKHVMLAMALFAVAFATKAVYVPLMGIVLLLLGRRELAGAARRRSIAVAVFLAIVLMVSFLLPLVFAAPGAVGDVRGGTAVNSGEQLRLILANPLGYLKTFIHFIGTNFLSLALQEDAMTNLAYLGDLNAFHPSFTGFVSLALVVIAVLDASDRSSKLISWRNACWTLFILFCAVALICTALYIDFTAVGSALVAGVQGRYATPLYLLFFAFVFNFRIQGIANRPRAAMWVPCLFGVLLYGSFAMMLVMRIMA